MNPGRRFFHIVALLILLVPLAVTSSSPHIDWYLFQVRGHVVRPAGSLDNYTVVLMVYDNWWDGGGWKRVRECTVRSVDDYGPLISTDLTDEDGAFALNVSTCEMFRDLATDTLVVAVLLPDTTILGAPFRVNSVRPTVVEATVDEGGSMCDSNEYTYVDGYVYKFPARGVPVP